jgi:hypothetical protein
MENALDVLRSVRSLSSNIKQRRAESSKKPEPQFHGKIDLRGFTYERIEINLDELSGTENGVNESKKRVL